MSRENFDTKGKKNLSHSNADRFLDILFPPYLGTYVVHSGLNIRCSLGRRFLGGGVGCVLCGVVVDLSLRPVVEGRGRMGEERVWAEKRNLGLCTNTHMQGGEKGEGWRLGSTDHR